MKFIRILWGDLNVFDGKFKTQIEKAQLFNIPDQIVYVWGEENNNFLTTRGFKTRLISHLPYEGSYGEGHHMFNYTSLLHKLKGFSLAVQEHKEAVFFDWDCFPTKEIDSNFFSYLNSGSPLQVPLYIYPYVGIEELLDNSKHEEFVVSFAKVLKENLDKFSYKEELGYVLPNTGFMYCRDYKIADRILNLALEHRPRAVPDEFGVMLLALEENLGLKDYILKYEPVVTNGKIQEDVSAYDWVKAQQFLNSLTSSLIKKDLYFNHV